MLDRELNPGADARLMPRPDDAPAGWAVSRAPVPYPAAVEAMEARAGLPELGGVELFLALERVTAHVLPLTLSGEVPLPPAETERAVYLFARELGDAKVWTSPLFIRSPRG